MPGVMQTASYWLNKHNLHNKQLNEQALNMINATVNRTTSNMKVKYFGQKKGIAMESPISSTTTEIYLQCLETIYIKHWLDSKEIFYKTYVDDILSLYYHRKIEDQMIPQNNNWVDKNLQFKLSSQINNTINYLDILICTKRKLSSSDYQPTETGTVIHLISNHPLEHKISAFLYYINQLTKLPITESSKQKEWETILTIPRNNDYPVSLIHN